MAYIGNNLDSDIQMNRYEYTATSGQTNFACTYDRAVDVYVNGIKLDSSDFTATNGTEIVLASGANAGDVVDINAYFDVTYADHYNKDEVDTLLANIDALPDQTGNAGKYLQTDGTDATWEEVQGAVSGIFYESAQTLSENYSLSTGSNAMAAGPLTVADGVTITVADGSSLTIV